MSKFEQEQTRLRLIPRDFIYHAENGDTVKGEQVYKQLDKNRVWQNDAEGKYIPVLFDGTPFRFREGKVITAGRTVANALLRSGRIIVGNGLNGPQVPFLEVVQQFSVGDQPDKNTSPTTCPICFEDQHTFPRLTRHLMKEKKLHPELFKDEAEPELEETEA